MISSVIQTQDDFLLRNIVENLLTIRDSHSARPVIIEQSAYISLDDGRYNVHNVNADSDIPITTVLFSVDGAERIVKELNEQLELDERERQESIKIRLEAIIERITTLNPNSYAPVETLEDLSTQDEDQMLKGYADGYAKLELNMDILTRSYWHGWRNGRVDAGLAQADFAQQALARAITNSKH